MSSKSKTLALSLALIILAASALFPNNTVKAQTRTLVVPDQYPTIESAIGNANAGETVFVKKGTYIYSVNYSYPIIIDKPLSLIGEDNEETIIRAFPSKYSQGLIAIKADNVDISGFQIESGDYISAISVGSNHCRIDKNIIKGYIVVTGQNCVISNNELNYIRVQANDSVISQNSIVGDSTFGIGISVSGHNVTICNNNIHNTTMVGSREFSGGIYLAMGGPFYVYGNNIENNQYFGLEFYSDCSNAKVYNNNFKGNDVGIFVPNFILTTDSPNVGVNNEVYNNNFIDNDINALVERSCIRNLTSLMKYNNGIIGNGTDVVSWDNGIAGNYWSDYNGNGSYVIDENNIDNRPLTQPAILTMTDFFQINGAWFQPLIITSIILAVVTVFAFLYRVYRKTPKLKQ